MRVGRGDAERLNVSRLPPHPSGLWPATFPPVGEGFGAVQIGKNCPLCGTFGYIYWEFGRSAPVGGGRPSVPPLRRRRGKPGRPRPTKGVGLGPAPAAEFGLKTAGAQCAPLQERRREPAPSSAPSGGTFPYPLCPFGTSSLPLLAFGHFPLTGGIGPLTRGVSPQGEGLGKTKRDRSGTCPLKHRGETQFRTKFLCFLSFSKKVGYTGPWRKRSIISWVREMADPPWGRFSRSNQVPSPSSSSWRVTVSSSVSRSQ